MIELSNITMKLASFSLTIKAQCLLEESDWEQRLLSTPIPSLSPWPLICTARLWRTGRRRHRRPPWSLPWRVMRKG
ncbi:hypothetical protein CHELA40_10807 [Chelatococcus asaccharovorans]|nr:hypothetical protein CHELA40_10807 [Chelatococcus asaccharovorans]CAH1686017.1 hypothetical protein CHELA17_64796 [Chelatococcus asaccharovorans]